MAGNHHQSTNLGTKMIRPMAFLVAVVLLLAPSLGWGQSVRWMRSAAVESLDPHSHNDRASQTLAHQYYEPLIVFDPDGVLSPGLAVNWSPSSHDSLRWHFELRRGVVFHDGTPFTARDVVFSLQRARQAAPVMREALAGIADAVVIDDYNLVLVTRSPDPVLPRRLTDFFIMSEAWAQEYQSQVAGASSGASGKGGYASRRENGTGPYRVVEYRPGGEVVLQRFGQYWGRDAFALDVAEIVYRSVESPESRVAAVISGDTDFLQDVPLESERRLQSRSDFRLLSGPAEQSIFLGMRQDDAPLRPDTERERNPLADQRVRRALDLALDRRTIVRVSLRGKAIAAGMMIPPLVSGWSPDLDRVTEVDLARARGLLAQAGYPDGFSLTLHCPNGLYRFDTKVCRAIVGMLGQLGIQMTLETVEKDLYIQQVRRRDADFYLLGWTVPDLDSGQVLESLIHSAGDEQGAWNVAGYSRPQLDRLIRAAGQTVDDSQRHRILAAIWKEVDQDSAYLPLYHHSTSWVVRNSLEGLKVQPGGRLYFKYVKIKQD